VRFTLNQPVPPHTVFTEEAIRNMIGKPFTITMPLATEQLGTIVHAELNETRTTIAITVDIGEPRECGAAIH
jgi:hypothetical protein